MSRAFQKKVFLELTNRRLSELTETERDDAHEDWLRANAAYCAPKMHDRLALLLSRLDGLRAELAAKRDETSKLRGWVDDLAQKGVHERSLEKRLATADTERAEYETLYRSAAADRDEAIALANAADRDEAIALANAADRDEAIALANAADRDEAIALANAAETRAQLLARLVKLLRTGATGSGGFWLEMSELLTQAEEALRGVAESEETEGE